MGDEGDRHAQLAFEPAQQLEDLRLHGDVQSRGRLVGDQEVGLAQERHGDHHPLAHAARELVRVHVEPSRGFRNAHELEHGDAAPPGLRLAHALVLAHHLGQLARDLQEWVERGHRVLEDHRQIVAADLVQAARRQIEDLLAAVAHRALAAAVLGEQAHDREEDLGLARPALAHHPQALAGPDREPHLVGRQHLAVRRGKARGEILDLEDGGHLSLPAPPRHSAAGCDRWLPA